MHVLLFQSWYIGANRVWGGGSQKYMHVWQNLVLRSLWKSMTSWVSRTCLSPKLHLEKAQEQENSTSNNEWMDGEGEIKICFH